MCARIAAFVLGMLSLNAAAQNSPLEAWAKADWQSRSVEFENTGYMAADMDSINTGNSRLTYFRHDNALRDVYTPTTSKGFAVESRRFWSTDEWSLSGNFRFARFDDLATPYTSSANPYTDNPYQIADSLHGDWKKQHYLLEANVLSPRLNRFTRGGIGLKYEVLNGARQKDPRPLDRNIHIAVVPSVMFQVNHKLTLGVNGFYGRRREELSISLENHLRPQEIYKLLGLGEYLYNGPIIFSGGLTRNFRGNSFGGGINLGYEFTPLRKLRIAATHKSHSENAVDGVSIPFLAGKHSYTESELKAVYLHTSSKMEQRVLLSGSFRDVSNTEYIQVLNNSTQQYEVVHTAEMHTINRLRTDISYSLLTNSNETPVWSLTLRAGISDFESRYPSNSGREVLDILTGEVALGRWFRVGKGSLEIGYNAMYRRPRKEALRYDQKSYSKNFAANKILIPAHAYQVLTHFRNTVDVSYFFPRFGQPFCVYLKASYGLYQNLDTNGFYPEKLRNRSVSFTIGLLN